jgi:uncharacterized protein (TIGR02246 family)
MESGAMSSDSSSIQSSLQNSRQTFELAIATADLDLLASLFDEEAWMLPPSNAVLKGKEAILKYYTGMLSVGQYEMRFAVEDLTLFGDHAVEVTNWVMTVKTADSVNHVAEGKSMVLWRNNGTEWQILRDMFSSNNPED